jgi:hypothetical protein
MSTSGRPARAHARLLLAATMALLGVMVASCGGDSWQEAVTTTPTSTTAPTTTTTSSTTTSTTTTTIPSGTVAGRVFLLDREEPVETTVDLVREEEDEPTATTRTDADGYYSFAVEEAGSYQVEVSVLDLLDVCDALRTEGEMSARWPIVVRTYTGSGVSDVRAASVAESVTIGGEVTFDLDLYCDEA